MSHTTIASEPARSGARSRPWRRTAASWLTALGAYWLVLFAATHVPAPDAVAPVMDFDKLIHAGSYAVLATLVLIAWRRTGVWPTWRGRLAVAALVLAYGAFDETTQPFFGRACELVDWLADAVGVAAAITLDQVRHGRLRPRSH